jgi:lipopolysaccharide transport system permease protein
VASIYREFSNNFARSKLGGMWAVISPLSQVAIYALILSNVLAVKIPGIESKYSYAIYLMSGILAWTLFSEIINRCLNMFTDRSNLIKKVSFPHIALPVIVIGYSLLNYVLLFLAVLVIFILLGHQFSLALFWLLPITVVLALLGLAIGLVLGILNVFVRDIGQMVPIVMQMWFWFTPIIYPVSIIPERYMYLMNFNPLYPIVSAYHNILVNGTAPSISGVVIISMFSVAGLLFGLYLFRKAISDLIDVL